MWSGRHRCGPLPGFLGSVPPRRSRGLYPGCARTRPGLARGRTNRPGRFVVPSSRTGHRLSSPRGVRLGKTAWQDTEDILNGCDWSSRRRPGTIRESAAAASPGCSDPRRATQFGGVVCYDSGCTAVGLLPGRRSTEGKYSSRKPGSIRAALGLEAGKAQGHGGRGSHMPSISFWPLVFSPPNLGSAHSTCKTGRVWEANVRAASRLRDFAFIPGASAASVAAADFRGIQTRCVTGALSTIPGRWGVVAINTAFALSEIVHRPFLF